MKYRYMLMILCLPSSLVMAFGFNVEVHLGSSDGSISNPLPVVEFSVENRFLNSLNTGSRAKSREPNIKQVNFGEQKQESSSDVYGDLGGVSIMYYPNENDKTVAYSFKKVNPEATSRFSFPKWTFFVNERGISYKINDNSGLQEGWHEWSEKDKRILSE